MLALDLGLQLSEGDQQVCSLVHRVNTLKFEQSGLPACSRSNSSAAYPNRKTDPPIVGALPSASIVFFSTPSPS